MLSQEIRRAFLKYFQNQGHTIVPSSPVIPHDDPTLLFINAGMNQFKDIFLGKSKREYKRAATTQKCIRVGGKHNDLDNVGHTTRHLTFFEMLGNFSFGDYFKKEAIGYAWDIATHIFSFDPEKIWVSVFQDDDEAFALWEKHVPAKRIVRLGEKDNFWAMGDTGPCGPCSELLYDRGSKYGLASNPKEDLSGERFFEFWNLVFMQFERRSDGRLDPLPQKSIDTGSGLERVASLKLGVETVFQTDILRSLIAQAEEVSKKNYDPANHTTAPAFHVIADHIRSLAFAIADGVQPSNTDRGYVLRKILRRAVRYGRLLGLQRPFLADILPRLISTMGDDFPELHTAQNRIAEILTLEEESFLRTLVRGGNILHSVIEASKQSDQKISGEDAFKLKDTYGFPLEEILLIAKDEGLHLDQARYQKLEEEAKEKSRKAHKTSSQTFESNFFADFAKTHKPCHFDGYQHHTLQARIIALLVDGKFVDRIEEGEEGSLILDQTPFYAEMGGQVGDTGKIEKGGSLFQVQNTASPFPGVIVHAGKMESGAFLKNDPVQAKIDETKRIATENNHTATHLLHWALQKVLGSHIKQAGSLVDPKKLRFDFSHHKPLSPQELLQIDHLVNEKIRENIEVKTYELAYSEAQKRDDIKQFFGEKYGSTVRVIDAECSKELCGGTHVKRTGSIGYFKVIKESSIAAGVRRIEAVSGEYAEEWVEQQDAVLQALCAQLKTSPSLLLEKFQTLLDENKELQSELKEHRALFIRQMASTQVEEAQMVGKIRFLAKTVELAPDELSILAEEMLKKLGSGVIALGSVGQDKCQLLISVSSDLISQNIHANLLIKEAASCIGGGGGGKSTLAQAGGKNPAGLPQAFEKIRTFLLNTP